MKSLATRLLVVALICAGAAPALAIAHAGDAAPVFTIANAKGGTLTSKAFAGKPVYYNFFASWCGPCNDEAPTVKALYAKYKSRGFTTVGIDELESPQTAQTFAKKYGWPFPIGVDADGKFLANYGGIGLPVHVFVDRYGKISTFRLGEMDPSDIEAAIKKIL